jgi:hypothetical protein
MSSRAWTCHADLSAKAELAIAEAASAKAGRPRSNPVAASSSYFEIGLLRGFEQLLANFARLCHF